MTMQIEDARNAVENPPPSTGEEGLVKTLVRGLVQSGGIYANARMAADQESEAQKREIHALAAEEAKAALIENIAAANEYIETLKQKIDEARNESTAAPNKDTEALQEAILEQDDETTLDETDEIIDITAEEDTLEAENGPSSVLEELGTEEEIEEATTQTEETEVDEAEVVAEMFGLPKATADVISELLFSGTRNAIQPNQRLDRRHLEKIALLLDAIDIDETEVEERTQAFLLHKGFDHEAIIQETIEAIINLWQQYQQQ